MCIVKITREDTILRYNNLSYAKCADGYSRIVEMKIANKFLVFH